jgi:hypothetical protein
MPLPILKKQLADKLLHSFCEKRIPNEHRDKIRLSYRFRGNSVTLIDSRPDMFDKDKWLDLSIAQFRYDSADEKWTLYFADRNDKWHMYMDCDSSKDLQDLIDEVNEDPTGIFFG